MTTAINKITARTTPPIATYIVMLPKSDSSSTETRMYAASSSVNVTVPSSVIRSDMEGRYVWTVSDDNTVCKTYVSTGWFSGKGVTILEGLSPGDRVISEGVQKVCTGMKVIIAE